MKTLVYSTPYMDDKIDLRNLFGKDQKMTDAEAAEKSNYVLFAPGSILAPPAIRAEGRTRITMTDEEYDRLHEHLLTHPVWYFRTEDQHAAHDARARQRAADQLGPVVAERVLVGVNTNSMPAPAETAPGAPSDPQAVIAAAAEQARVDAQNAKERAALAKAEADEAARVAKEAADTQKNAAKDAADKSE